VQNTSIHYMKEMQQNSMNKSSATKHTRCNRQTLNWAHTFNKR